jgi:hypothetical protein
LDKQDEKMSFCLFFSCLFLTDFVSYWFQVYSSYLLDQESHITPNPMIQAFLKLLKNPIMSFIMNTLAEIYTFSFYMKFYPNHFEEIRQHPMYPFLMQFALYGAILKIIHNSIHIWVSSIRIVGLDVKTKNNPPPPASQENKKAN